MLKHDISHDILRWQSDNLGINLETLKYSIWFPFFFMLLINNQLFSDLRDWNRYNAQNCVPFSNWLCKQNSSISFLPVSNTVSWLLIYFCSVIFRIWFKQRKIFGVSYKITSNLSAVRALDSPQIRTSPFSVYM